MTPFSKFSFSKTPSRRHVALSDVMPIDEKFEYVVVLSDAYLVVNGDEKHIDGFRDLCDAIGTDDGLQALRVARAKGQLTEGRHTLPDAIIGYLIGAGTAPLHVRRWTFGASTPVLSTFPLTYAKDVCSSSNFEELEVCDAAGTWYFRARDDDPLVFLALPKGALSEAIERFHDCCRSVSGEFEYAV